LGVKILEII